MRQKIGIKKWEERTSKAGKAYLVCQTNKGPMSVWDIALAGTIMDAPDNSVFDLEYTIEGRFMTIVNIYDVGAPGSAVSNSEPSNLDAEKIIGTSVSYAKDAWCAGKIEKEEMLETAKGFIALQKQLLKEGI